jgi:hypothetical protein
MKRSRFTGEQIVMILREQEVCGSVTDLCRERGISSRPFDLTIHTSREFGGDLNHASWGWQPIADIFVRPYG